MRELEKYNDNDTIQKDWLEQWHAFVGGCSIDWDIRTILSNM